MLRLLGWGVIVVFAALYAAALAIYVIGIFGLFGQEADPMAGAFLVPLGSPWNRVVDYLPEALWPLLTAIAPMANLLLLWVLLRPRKRSAKRSTRT